MLEGFDTNVAICVIKPKNCVCYEHKFLRRLLVMWFLDSMNDHHGIFNGRNEVLAKVIFSQASVILFTVGGGLVPRESGLVRGVSNFFWGGFSKFFGGLQIFGGGFLQIFLGGLQIFGGRGVSNFSGGGGAGGSAGTHPTGMHSCYLLFTHNIFFIILAHYCLALCQ